MAVLRGWSGICTTRCGPCSSRRFVGHERKAQFSPTKTASGPFASPVRHGGTLDFNFSLYLRRCPSRFLWSVVSVAFPVACWSTYVVVCVPSSCSPSPRGVRSVPQDQSTRSSLKNTRSSKNDRLRTYLRSYVCETSQGFAPCALGILLQASSLDILDMEQYRGRTALQLAASVGNMTAVQQLVSHGAGASRSPRARIQSKANRPQ